MHTNVSKNIVITYNDVIKATMSTKTSAYYKILVRGQICKKRLVTRRITTNGSRVTGTVVKRAGGLVCKLKISI